MVFNVGDLVEFTGTTSGEYGYISVGDVVRVTDVRDDDYKSHMSIEIVKRRSGLDRGVRPDYWYPMKEFRLYKAKPLKKPRVTWNDLLAQKVGKHVK